MKRKIPGIAMWLNRHPIREFGQYLSVSVIALAIDYVTYVCLVYTQWLAIPMAAGAGYLVGLCISYWMIRHRVFTDGWLRHQKKREFMLFLMSGALGLSLTFLTSELIVSWLGPNPQLAKFTAVIVSFTCVYVFRKFIVFKRIRY